LEATVVIREQAQLRIRVDPRYRSIPSISCRHRARREVRQPLHSGTSNAAGVVDRERVSQDSQQTSVAACAMRRMRGARAYTYSRRVEAGTDVRRSAHDTALGADTLFNPTYQSFVECGMSE
jgi:hypothetical protein